ncbi:MAG TPA: helix-turn-helix domain-containing protein [Pyrinomonadaceae bacterium]
MNSENQRFYTVDEIAAELRVSRRTIERLIQAKKLKANKFGANVKIEKTDFDEFIEKTKTFKWWLQDVSDLSPEELSALDPAYEEPQQD